MSPLASDLPDLRAIRTPRAAQPVAQRRPPKPHRAMSRSIQSTFDKRYTRLDDHNIPSRQRDSRRTGQTQASARGPLALMA